MFAGLFRRKAVLPEATDGPGLRRVLGPVQLPLLGIGAIIGTGIFVLTGTAAAGSAGHLGAGPGLIVSMASVLLVMQLGQTRIFFAMSRDGLLPHRFSRVHARFRTPVLPTVLTGLAVSLAAGLIDISAAAELTNIGTLFAFILVAGGVWWLRVHQPDFPRGFRVPMLPLVSFGAMASCLYLMLGLPTITWERFGLWFLVGLVVYFVYGRWHSNLNDTPSDPASVVAHG